MPLITKKKSNNITIKIAIDSELAEEIEKYCTFAKLDSKDDFLNESAKYILERDKDWKKHKKSNKNQ